RAACYGGGEGSAASTRGGSAMTDRPKPTPPRPDKTILTHRQNRAAVLIATGVPVATAAKELRASPGTLWARMRLPVFAERLAELRRAVTTEVIDKITTLLAVEGTAVIESRLTAVFEKTGQRVASVEDVAKVAELLIGLRSAGEVQSRLEAIEQ